LAGKRQTLGEGHNFLKSKGLTAKYIRLTNQDDTGIPSGSNPDSTLYQLVVPKSDFSTLFKLSQSADKYHLPLYDSLLYGLTSTETVQFVTPGKWNIATFNTVKLTTGQQAEVLLNLLKAGWGKGWGSSTPIFNPAYDQTARDKAEAFFQNDKLIANMIDQMDLTAEDKEKVKEEIQLVLDHSRFTWQEWKGPLGGCVAWQQAFWDRASEVNTRERPAAQKRWETMSKYFQVSSAHWDVYPHQVWYGMAVNPMITTMCIPSVYGFAAYPGPGHNAIRIEFRNGNVIYIDDGNLGGDDQVFIESEIPYTYVPR
jgi:hypothetical protein